jgi:CelD/BcsL family acetyltransferase involved in cellulose biosynthesis
MGTLQLHILNSIQDVEAIADSWNDLWQLSDVSVPTARTEFIKLWLDDFAPRNRFRALIVEDGNRLIAALPIVERRWAGVIQAGGLPRNEWSGAGDLLVDPAADVYGAMALIVQALAQLPWPVLRFTHVRWDSFSWQSFVQTLRNVGIGVECRPSHEVKLIPVAKSWEDYQQQFSKNHRQRLKRLLKRSAEEGTVRLVRHVPENWAEAEPLLHKALEIEDSGWKGRAKTSLLGAPNIAKHVLNLSQCMLADRELEIAFLELQERPISFQILWNSKGVLHAYKGSYDERYRHLSPGHLLIYELLRELCESQRCRAYDCYGPNTPAINHWSGRTYRTCQITVAPRNWLGRAMLFTYRHCRRPPADWNELSTTSRESRIDGTNGNVGFSNLQSSNNWIRQIQMEADAPANVWRLGLDGN